MSHTLIQIGNSKALIIPSKIIRKKKYDTSTQFDIVETSDGFRIIQKQPGLESLDFPKAGKQQISDKIKSLQGTVSFSDKEIEQDERLKYILSR